MFKKLILLSFSLFGLNGLTAEPAQTAQNTKEELISKIIHEVERSGSQALLCKQ